MAYNLPYDLFVMAARMNELLNASKNNSPILKIYRAISDKAVAALSLLGDNIFDSCYPICRAIIELFCKVDLV